MLTALFSFLSSLFGGKRKELPAHNESSASPVRRLDPDPEPTLSEVSFVPYDIAESVLRWEGGFFLDDTVIAGKMVGNTYMGVTQRYYNNQIKVLQGQGFCMNYPTDVRGLSRDQVIEYYHLCYWIPLRDLKVGKSVIAIMAHLLIMSPRGAVIAVQEVARVKADGKWGVFTKRALEQLYSTSNGVAGSIAAAFLRKRVKDKYYRGWSNRLNQVLDEFGGRTGD